MSKSWQFHLWNKTQRNLHLDGKKTKQNKTNWQGEILNKLSGNQRYIKYFQMMKSRLSACALYSGITGRGETSDREISADLQGKERQGKKGKWSSKEGKWKGEVENLQWKEEKVQNEENHFSFFFFFFFAFHFSKCQNDWNLFWV